MIRRYTRKTVTNDIDVRDLHLTTHEHMVDAQDRKT